MPRYVVLEHTGSSSYKPGRHWDLMLEVNERLRTWELGGVPSPGESIRAVPLPDHRLEYLDYEGPVAGNRGAVRQWDAGEYDTLCETAFELKVQLDGQQLQGRLHLRRDLVEVDAWLVAFEPA